MKERSRVFGPRHPLDVVRPHPTDLRHPLLHLQRLVGNQAVAGMVVQRAPRRGRKRSAPPTSPSAQLAAQVAREVGLGRFIEPEEALPRGTYGPPRPGGAFWLLNGLNPTDLAQVLRDCTPAVRGQLMGQVPTTAGRYDTPRLTAALRAASWGEHASGASAISLLDAIRSAQTATPPAFGPVWASLAGQPRPQVIATLRVLPREVLVTLQGQLSDAPAADQPMLTQVIADLLGTGTDMSAEDVIDVQPLRGLERIMASIYNHRGQLLHEQASVLGIGTAAAAGIMKVESGGETFSAATNLSITRFENHVFWDRWGRTNTQVFNQHFDFNRTGHRWEGHRFRDNVADAWSGFHGNQANERRVLALAVSLAGGVAYECASFGAGQIMGFNHGMVGFASAREMVEAYDRSERSQVTGIFQYIRTARLAAAVRRGDFAAVARGYNGTGQVPTYAARMQEAADAYARVTAGRRHVIP